MPQMTDVSMVTVQGGYIAKQCPVVIQNRVLVPTEEAELPAEVIHRMDAGIEFEAVTLDLLRGEEPESWVVIPQQPKDIAIQATVDAMKARAAVIESAFLPMDEKGRRTGRPDLLIRSVHRLRPGRHQASSDPQRERGECPGIGLHRSAL